MPIHDADGRIISPRSMCRPTGSYHNADTAALLMAALLDGAQVVERQLFTEAFRDCRIMLLGSQPGAGPAMVGSVTAMILVIRGQSCRTPAQRPDQCQRRIACACRRSVWRGRAGSACRSRAPRAASGACPVRLANVAAAARSLGIGRATFYRRMERAGLN